MSKKRIEKLNFKVTGRSLMSGLEFEKSAIFYDDDGAKFSQASSHCLQASAQIRQCS
jgi:hypothetical protein